MTPWSDVGPIVLGRVFARLERETIPGPASSFPHLEGDVFYFARILGLDHNTISDRVEITSGSTRYYLPRRRSWRTQWARPDENPIDVDVVEIGPEHDAYQLLDVYSVAGLSRELYEPPHLIPAPADGLYRPEFYVCGLLYRRTLEP